MDRNIFISRISERLGHERSRPEPHYLPIGISDNYRNNPYGSNSPSYKGLSDRFGAELEAIGGTVHVAESLVDAAGILKAIAKKAVGSQIATWARGEFAEWKVDFLWDDLGAFAYTSQSPLAVDDTLKSRMFSAIIGVTTVDYAVVNTGSLVLYTNSRRARSVSLLPATHVALVKESQLVTRIGEAMPGPGTNGFAQIPSSIHFITGPSRSADIENDLSIGVHGPAALTVIVCNGI